VEPIPHMDVALPTLAESRYVTLALAPCLAPGKTRLSGASGPRWAEQTPLTGLDKQLPHVGRRVPELLRNRLPRRPVRV